MVENYTNLFTSDAFPDNEFWSNQFIHSIFQIADELNLIIEDVDSENFETSIFEYNERFFVGVYNNVLVRLNPYYAISTLQEFSAHNDENNKAIGRADLLINFKNGKENKISMLVEAKKWKTTKKYLEEEWVIFFDLNDNESGLSKTKKQLEKYTRDSYACDKSDKKLVLIFEHISLDEEEKILDDYILNLEKYADFFQVIVNSKKENDFMVVYGKFI